MLNPLRQSTNSQSVTLGPYLDETDGKTPETALTIANTDIKLMANGGASANKNSGGGTHRANGEYGVTLNATDTAALGELKASSVVSGALPVTKTFWVFPAAVYDAFFGSSAAGFALTGDIAAALTATVADSIPADGARPSIAQGIYMLVQFLLECSVVGTTMTIKKPDGSTTLFQITLNDASTPTSKTRTS